MSDVSALPPMVSRLLPAVTTKTFGQAEPGEIVALLDGGIGGLALVARYVEQDGKEVPLLVLLHQPRNDEEPGISWLPYDVNRAVLSYGKAPCFQFDPTQLEPKLASFSSVPVGSLIVGPKGVRLRAARMGGSFSHEWGEFDIGSGMWAAKASDHTDVIIPSWELHLPRAGQPPQVLFTFSARTR